MNKKIVLRDDQMPLQWYNVVPDLPGGLQPPLDPETKEPMGPEKLSAIFPMGLLEQEMTAERFVDIPEEVLDILKIWRPSPLVRATNLEKALNTKAKIYFKNEGVSPVGSHKPNTAVAQAYYNAREGIKRIATETGAGQWGSSLAFAGRQFGRNKLAPRVSPGKTWEGVLGALAACSLFAFGYARFIGLQCSALAGFILVCLVTVLFSIAGDLLESLLKRQRGIKDSGTLIPGHGGILDRIDALLFAIPLAYLFKAYLT